MKKLIAVLQEKRVELQKELAGDTPDYGTIGYGKMEAYEQWLEWLENIILVDFPEGEFE